jgi:hypothetical protein
MNSMFNILIKLNTGRSIIGMKDIDCKGEFVFSHSLILTPSICRDTEPFEWYYPYKNFQHIINDFVAKEAKVLYAGCGL